METRTGARLILAGLVAATVAMMLFTPGATAQVSDPYGGGTPTVLPTVLPTETPSVLPTMIDRDKSTPEASPTVQGIRITNEDDGEGPQTLPSAQTQPGILPFTGGDVVLYLLIAAVLIGLGSVLVRKVRTERTDG